MFSNIKGSPRTTVVGVLIALFGAASALGGFAGLPPNARAACGVVATLAGVGLGLFGVDPSKALPAPTGSGSTASGGGPA